MFHPPTTSDGSSIGFWNDLWLKDVGRPWICILYLWVLFLLMIFG